MTLFDSETPSPTPGDLPVAGYDHLPLPALEQAVRDLGRADIDVLLRYERENRDRTPVVRVLTARLSELRHAAERERRTGGYGPPRMRRPQPAGTRRGSRLT